MSILTYLAQTKTLWMTFWLTVILTAAFGVVMYIGQFGIIDEMYIAEDIRAHIDAMTPRQRIIHAWMTGTLDVAYPLAYGAFFIGIAIKYFRRFGLWLALPSILVIPTDLIEGFAQIMLLTGQESFMGLKVMATPAKLIFFLLGLCITIMGLCVAAKRFIESKALILRASAVMTAVSQCRCLSCCSLSHTGMVP